MNDKQQIIVTVDAQSQISFDAVCHNLQDRGFRIETKMQITGNIIGTFDGGLDELKVVSGVIAAERASDMHPQ